MIVWISWWKMFAAPEQPVPVLHHHRRPAAVMILDGSDADQLGDAGKRHHEHRRVADQLRALHGHGFEEPLPGQDHVSPRAAGGLPDPRQRKAAGRVVDGVVGHRDRGRSGGVAQPGEFGGGAWGFVVAQSIGGEAKAALTFNRTRSPFWIKVSMPPSACGGRVPIRSDPCAIRILFPGREWRSRAGRRPGARQLQSRGPRGSGDGDGACGGRTAPTWRRAAGTRGGSGQRAPGTSFEFAASSWPA